MRTESPNAYLARAFTRGLLLVSVLPFSPRCDSCMFHDSIEAYLDSPKIPIEEINQVGGILKYWEQALTLRPGVARMALDFLSAPGMFLLLTPN
jgi:hypothetical protein